MADLFDYLAWSGDQSIAASPLNDVDALILSRLAYLPFDGIVPESFADTVTLAEAERAFARLPDAASRLIMQNDGDLFAAAGRSPRFAALRLSGFIRQNDTAQEKQFCALTFTTGDGLPYVAFRGTDATLLGWKESLNMCFMLSVPAQQSAVRYLRAAADALPGPLRVGGHSKGGNLAVYASAFCPDGVRERITRVYNHDGPGLHSAVLRRPGYQAVKDRVRRIIPQSSVVGMMLSNEEPSIVIQSAGVGLFQHDLYLWEVRGDGFVPLDDVSAASKFIDGTLKDWLRTLDTTGREHFVDALYEILGTTQAETLPELAENWRQNAPLILKKILTLDEPMRGYVRQALRLLMRAALDNASRLRPELPDNLPFRSAKHAREKKKRYASRA